MKFDFLMGGSTYIFSNIKKIPVISIKFATISKNMQRNLQTLKFWIITFFLIVLQSNCGKRKSEKESNTLERNLTNQEKWFANPNNFENPKYKDSLFGVFNAFNKKGEFQSAVRILNSYGTVLSFVGIPDSLFIATSKAFFTIHKNKIDQPDFAEISYYIGEEYQAMREFDSSNLWLQKCMIKTDNKRILQTQGFANIILSANLSSKNLLDSSAKVSLKAVELFKQIKDTANLANAYLGISAVYTRMKMPKESEVYDRLCLKLSKPIKDSQNIFAAYYNLTLVNDKLNKPDSMMHFAKLLLTHVTAWQPNEPMFFGHGNLNFALALLRNNKLDSVNHYISIAEKCGEGIPDLTEKVIYAKYKYLYQMKRPLNEINTLLKLNERFIPRHNFIGLVDNYSFLSYHAEKTGDKDLALQYLKKTYLYRDSLWDETKRWQILDLNTKYETAEKERKILLQANELQTSKFRITLLIFGLVGLILSALIFFLYRKRKETKTAAALQEKFTIDLLQNTEDERKRIATDLHDGVNHELLTLKNAASNGKLADANDIEKVISEVRQVSRDLYPAMFDNIGLAASIENLCERITEAGLFTTCEINYTLKLSKRNELQLYRIIQEALNNTLKHAKANAAKVTIDTVGNELQVEIKDNGIGFNAEEKMVNASSFGIQSLIQRAKAMGGKSSIESTAQGTKLILKTPIH